jgi:hypothetical protein
VAAIRALFQLGYVPKDGRILSAMVAASRRAAVVCNGRGTPPRFSIAEWRAAADAAGGPAVASPVIRAARQQCRDQMGSRSDADNTAFAAEVELAEVIRQLDGRLV